MPAAAVSLWPTPDRFDDDDVVAGRFAHQHRLAGLLGHAAQGAAGRAGPDIGLLVHRQLLHPGLVAEDRSAGNGAGRIDGEHRDPVTLRDQGEAQRLDESALAHARHAADAQAERLPGMRQQTREHLVGLAPVVAAGRFQQRDGLGDGAALHRSGSAQHLLRQIHDAVAHRSRPCTTKSASRCAHCGYSAGPGWKPSAASKAGSLVQRSGQKPQPLPAGPVAHGGVQRRRITAQVPAQRMGHRRQHVHRRQAGQHGPARTAALLQVGPQPRGFIDECFRGNLRADVVDAKRRYHDIGRRQRRQRHHGPCLGCVHAGARDQLPSHCAVQPLRQFVGQRQRQRLGLIRGADAGGG